MILNHQGEKTLLKKTGAGCAKIWSTKSSEIQHETRARKLCPPYNPTNKHIHKKEAICRGKVEFETDLSIKLSQFSKFLKIAPWCSMYVLMQHCF